MARPKTSRAPVAWYSFTLIGLATLLRLELGRVVTQLVVGVEEVEEEVLQREVEEEVEA